MLSPGPESSPAALRVAVIGGGPSGTFFTYCLQEQCRKLNRPVEVTIFEPKTFEMGGAFHCNYCQGVISAGLLRAMENIGLVIPDQVIQAQIKSYHLIALGGELVLPAPENQHIYTVFRGHGPVPQRAGSISFDQFLLDKALEGGARKQSVQVREVEIAPGDPNPVKLIDHLQRSYYSDFVVGAYGVNSKIGLQFEKLSFGYRPPATNSALQAEFRCSEADRLRLFGEEIKIFLLGLYPIRFAVITPKRGHLTVSLIGEKLKSGHLDDFMEHPLVRKHLAGDLQLSAMRCSCAPLIPITDGGELAGEHCLIIGDAAVSRYYKNGIESALSSAELAAEVLSRHGAAPAALLRRCYTERLKARFRLDNYMGRLLFRMHDQINRLPTLSRAQLAIARGDFGLTGHSSRSLRWILWNMFTGDTSYRKIFLRSLDPVLLCGIVFSTLKTYLSGKLRKLFSAEQAR